jgi:hypothetical protein
MNIFNIIVKQTYAVAGVDVVGTLQLPAGIPSDISKTNLFFSAIIRMFMVVAGIFTLWQFLSGGFEYISSGGDKTKITNATQKLTMSLTGLIVMTASFIVISIISKILFNDFTYILNPILQTVN